MVGCQLIYGCSFVHSTLLKCTAKGHVVFSYLRNKNGQCTAEHPLCKQSGSCANKDRGNWQLITVAANRFAAESLN